MLVRTPGMTALQNFRSRFRARCRAGQCTDLQAVDRQRSDPVRPQAVPARAAARAAHAAGVAVTAFALALRAARACADGKSSQGRAGWLHLMCCTKALTNVSVCGHLSAACEDRRHGSTSKDVQEIGALLTALVAVLRRSVPCGPRLGRRPICGSCRVRGRLDCRRRRPLRALGHRCRPTVVAGPRRRYGDGAHARWPAVGQELAQARDEHGHMLCRQAVHLRGQGVCLSTKRRRIRN